ncbi:MAG TPA: DUF2188 domain-containing protein [Rhodanobacteraceae bacterium]|jgi:hypothetical protein|nr:DUF2188 domain-containing protein [Rhodanobacteraceae bacterium]
MARRLLSIRIVQPACAQGKEWSMGQVIYFVEPESHSGRWHIRHSGRIRATYRSRAQAITDARQLASFDNELRGAAAIVRVLNAERSVSEDFVCDRAFRETVSATENALSANQ